MITTDRNSRRRADSPIDASTPRAVAARPFSRAIWALRLSAEVSSVLENAMWNHLVVKPESGNAGVSLLLKAKIRSTTSGA